LEPKLLTGHTIIIEAMKEDYAFSHFHNFKTKAKAPSKKKVKIVKLKLQKRKRSLNFLNLALYYFSLYLIFFLH